MLSIGIIWNTCNEFRDEILNIIKEHATILSVTPLNLCNDIEYEKFVRGIYELDSIADWKVTKKLDHMLSCSQSREVTIIKMNVPTNETFYHQYKKCLVYKSVETLKHIIRDTYSKKISDYFFDIVFHMSDNIEESSNDINYLRSYCSL